MRFWKFNKILSAVLVFKLYKLHENENFVLLQYNESHLQASTVTADDSMMHLCKLERVICSA